MGQLFVRELGLQRLCVGVPVDLVVLQLLQSAFEAINHVLRPELVMLAPAFETVHLLNVAVSQVSHKDLVLSFSL